MQSPVSQKLSKETRPRQAASSRPSLQRPATAVDLLEINDDRLPLQRQATMPPRMQVLMQQQQQPQSQILSPLGGQSVVNQQLHKLELKLTVGPKPTVLPQVKTPPFQAPSHGHRKVYGGQEQSWLPSGLQGLNPWVLQKSKQPAFEGSHIHSASDADLDAESDEAGDGPGLSINGQRLALLGSDSLLPPELASLQLESRPQTSSEARPGVKLAHEASSIQAAHEKMMSITMLSYNRAEFLGPHDESRWSQNGRSAAPTMAPAAPVGKSASAPLLPRGWQGAKALPTLEPGGTPPLQRKLVTHGGGRSEQARDRSSVAAIAEEFGFAPPLPALDRFVSSEKERISRRTDLVEARAQSPPPSWPVKGNRAGTPAMGHHRDA